MCTSPAPPHRAEDRALCYGSHVTVVLYSLCVTPSSSLDFRLIAGTPVHELEHIHPNDKVCLLQRGPPRHPRGRSSGESECLGGAGVLESEGVPSLNTQLEGR